MSFASEVGTIVEALGEAGQETGDWPLISDALQYFGNKLGFGAEVIDAAANSQNVVQFFGKLTANIEGGDVGAAAAVALAASLEGALLSKLALVSESPLFLAGTFAGLPEIVAVGALAGAIALGATGGAAAGETLFDNAYNSLASALPAPSDPGTWTQIGTDASGNSLLLNSVFNSSLSAALGLSSDSTMLADIAGSATGSGAVASGDISASSLLADANLIGAAVAAGELGGAQILLGPVNLLVGSGATEALCEIAVQYAGDQAASANAEGGFLLDPNPKGDFSASTPSVLSVDLNPADWTTTYAQAQPTILGVQPLLDAVSNNLLGAGASTAWVDNYLSQNSPSLIEAALSSGATLDGTQAAPSYKSSNADAVLIGQNDSTINAGDGDNLIIGGENVTAGNGNNIIVGTGGESINVGSGSNFVFAAGTNNVIQTGIPSPTSIDILYNGLDNGPVGNATDPFAFQAVPVADFSEQNFLDLNAAAFASAYYEQALAIGEYDASPTAIGLILYPVAPAAQGGFEATNGSSWIPWALDLADFQEPDSNPPPSPPQPAPPTQPAQPSDPGPSAGFVSETLNVGASLDLTAAILGAATPGQPGDRLSIAGVSDSGTLGTVSLNNGDVTYTASASSFASLGANSSEADSFAYTLTDQLGDATIGSVALTIDNPVAAISGPQYGGGTIEGVPGPEVINASGYNNVIDADGGSGMINAGLGSANVIAGSGNLTINLAGYTDVVSGDDGDDVVSGSQGNANISLGNGQDQITTGGYNNSITVGNGNDVIQAGAGNETVVAGAGNNQINAQGYGNQITLGAGANNVNAGAGSDQVTAYGGSDSLVFDGWDDVVSLLNGAGAAIQDQGGGLEIKVGSPTSVVSVTGFDPQGWIDLIDPSIGYSSSSQALAALTSDGHGGTLLPLAGSGSIDFAALAPTQLHASNFVVG